MSQTNCNTHHNSFVRKFLHYRLKLSNDRKNLLWNYMFLKTLFPKEENFTDKMKEVLLEIANFIVGEEINANLAGIHPVYDTKKMMPSWKVDSLLCAAYFSIFYLKPELELYRPCDNPKCGKYFLVRTTTTKIRFCSTECCNCVTQARYRKKKREKESK